MGKGKTLTTRSKNWTEDEKKALVDAVAPVYDKLFGAFSNEVSVEEKGKLWEEIRLKVNASSLNNRDLDSIKNKWTDLKSRVKALAMDILRQKGYTGRNEQMNTTMTEVEEVLAELISMHDIKVIRLIGITALLGISGGIDTEDLDVTVPTNAPEQTETISLQSKRPKLAATSKRQQDDEDSSSKKLLEIQEKLLLNTENLIVLKELNTNVARTADALEEIVWLQKYRLGLPTNLPTSSFRVVNPPPNQSNTSELDGKES